MRSRGLPTIQSTALADESHDLERKPPPKEFGQRAIVKFLELLVLDEHTALCRKPVFVYPGIAVHLDDEEL